MISVESESMDATRDGGFWNVWVWPQLVMVSGKPAVADAAVVAVAPPVAASDPEVVSSSELPQPAISRAPTATTAAALYRPAIGPIPSRSVAPRDD